MDYCKSILFTCVIFAAASALPACSRELSAPSAPLNRVDLATMPPDQLVHRLTALFGDQLIPDGSNGHGYILTYWTAPKEDEWVGRCTSNRVTFTFRMDHAPGKFSAQEDIGSLTDTKSVTLYSSKSTTGCNTVHPEKGEPFFLADSEWAAKFGPQIWDDIFIKNVSVRTTCTVNLCDADGMTRIRAAAPWSISDCGSDEQIPANRCLLYRIQGGGIGGNSVAQIYFDTENRPVHVILSLVSDARVK